MDKSIELLKSIQKVNLPEGLYEKIEQKIKQDKGNVISMTWLKAAAAVFVLLFSTEVYLLSDKQNSDDLAEIFPTVTNTLYDE